jgi:hypothetical protein
MKPVSAGVAIATALACAVAVAACGFGAGPSSGGTATLTVTRDYGSRTLAEATDSEADITTRYGGGFVQSIDGLAGTGESDWFFYVDGIESPVGSADVQVKGGQRIWWDYRNWAAAMSVPAVVGSWPEPFAQASADHPEAVPVECLGVRPACDTTSKRLAGSGVKAPVVEHGAPASSMRVLVGPWARVGADPAVDELRDSPQGTGVFATFKGPIHGGWDLIGLDQGGHPARDLGQDSGLVAALRDSGGAPVWIVTGSGSSAVRRAADALTPDSLQDHYAVAATPNGSVPLPVVRGGAG